MTEREIEFLYRAYERIDKRQDEANNRVDGLVDSIDRMRQQNAKEHAAVVNKIDKIAVERGERLEDVEAQVLQLTAKTGAELGRVKAAVDSIERRKRIFAGIVSGEFLDRYKMIFVALLVVFTLIFGYGLLRYTGELIGISAPTPSHVVTITTPTKTAPTK